jgi:tetratricopeptide (TPR) repeat protein
LTLAKHILLTATCSLFLGFSSSAQKKKTKYTDFDHGHYFFWNNKWDSAFLMFSRYVDNADDSLKKGTAYKFMGEIQWNIGDLYGAQENLTSAIDVLDPSNKKHHEELGITYNILGNVSLGLKLYDDAIGFYNDAIGFAKGTDYTLDAVNGKAIVFQKMEKYDDAIAIYDSILTFKPENQRLVARMIDNRGRTKWLQNPGYKALPEFRTALKMRDDIGDHAGVVTSYSHLSDYYAKLKPDSALWYAQQMFEKATEMQSAEDRLEATEKLVRLNNIAAIKERWYNAYIKLNDSLQYAKDTTRNRFALIRYGVEKSKADNLTLKFDIEKRKVDYLELQRDNSRQRLLLYVLIVLAVSVIAGLIAWYRKRRKRIKQEAENAIRNARLKTSQKVHDVVANGLYRIMNELEHGKEIEKEPLLDKIETLYEKSRDISYEDLTVAAGADQQNQLHELLMGFDDEQTKVFIVGDMQSFRGKISAHKKDELHLVLTELMVNMKKHSRAKNVIVEFKQEDDKAIIHYKDDGIGFGPDPEFGNGLKNTVSRIQALKGDVNFGKSGKAGASIIISFPV